MKDERPENMAANEAEKVMRRFWRGVKVEKGGGGVVAVVFWKSLLGCNETFWGDNGESCFSRECEAIIGGLLFGFWKMKEVI